MVKVVAVIGSKDSGKTSTIEYLISNFKNEGYKVGSVKHVHKPDFTIDIEGKDTWRYAQAGAKVIVLVASREVAIIKKGVPKIKLEEMVKNLEEEGLDIIFIEGFRYITAERGDIYKIVTAKDEEDLEKIMKDMIPPVVAITGKVAKINPKLRNLGVPIIDLNIEGNKLIQIVKNHLI